MRWTLGNSRANVPLVQLCKPTSVRDLGGARWITLSLFPESSDEGCSQLLRKTATSQRACFVISTNQTHAQCMTDGEAGSVRVVFISHFDFFSQQKSLASRNELSLRSKSLSDRFASGRPLRSDEVLASIGSTHEDYLL